MKSTQRMAFLVAGLVVVAGALWWLADEGATGPGPTGTALSSSRPTFQEGQPQPALEAGDTGEARQLVQAEAAAPPLDEAGSAGDAAAAERSARPSLAITGRIADAAGRSITAAEVTFVNEALGFGLRSGRGRGRRSSGAQLDAEQRDVLPFAVTDRDGRFRLEVDVPGSDRGDDLPFFLRRGPRLVVGHDDFATLVHDCSGLTVRDPDVGTLHLELGASVSGRVVGTDGLPLAGVELEVRHDDPDQRMGMAALFGGSLATAFNRVTTTADGRFEVRGVEAGPALLTARRDDLQLRRLDGLELAPQVPERVGDLVMEPGASITGRVLATGGEPLQGAEIRVSSLARIVLNRTEGLPRDEIGHEFSLRAATDEDGTFTISGLRGGTYTVHVALDGYAPLSRENVATGARNLVLSLRELGSILLTLTREDDGAPLVGAAIRPSPGGSMMRRWWTGAQGMDVLEGEAAAREAGVEGPFEGLYLVRGADTEGTTLEISADGFAAVEVTAPGAPEGGLATMDVTLRPESVVAGRVVDVQGEPVAEASIILSKVQADAGNMMFGGSHGRWSGRREIRLGDDEGQAADVRRGRSAEDGSFLLNGVSAGEWELSARAEGHVRGEPEPVSLAEGESLRDLVLVLEPGGSIAGLVTGEDGTPVPGARVQVSPDTPRQMPQLDGRGGMPRELMRMLSGMGGSGTRRARTDGKGWYEVDGLEPGAYRVTLQSEGGGMRMGRSFVMVMEGMGGPSDEDEAVLTQVVAGGQARVDLIRPPAAGLSGRVLAGGQPVQGVGVTLGRPFSFGGGRSATTDRSGLYRFEDVEPGEYEVSALVPGAVVEEQQTVKLEPGVTAQADLVFGGATLRGRVVDRDTGRGVAGATITAEPGDGGGEQEQMEISIVTAFQSRGGGPGRRGGPPRGLQMELGGSFVSKVRTDDRGRFEVRYLRPGSWVVRCSGGGCIPGSSEVVQAVEGKATEDVLIEVERGAVVEGRVVSGESGDRLDDVPVRIERTADGDVFSSMVTTREGSFRFEGLEAGEYEVTALGSGFGSEPLAIETVVVEVGERVSVDLTTRT